MTRPIPIEVPALPANNTTYSQAIRVGELIFVSGQLGIDPSTRSLVGGGIQAQTKQAIDNIATILLAANCALDRVVKVTVFLTDFALLPEMNKVYAMCFPHRPAKTSVEIVRLDKDALIEIEAIAML